jgi:hypothetical protein
MGDKIEFKLDALTPSQVVEEVKYEEFVRCFELGSERLKAFWYIPLKNIYQDSKNDFKVIE